MVNGDEQATLVAELRWLADGLPDRADLLRRAAELLDGWEPVQCAEHNRVFMCPPCRLCEADLNPS